MFRKLVVICMAVYAVSSVPLSHDGCSHTEQVSGSLDTSASGVNLIQQPLNYARTVLPHLTTSTAGFNFVEPHVTVASIGTNFVQPQVNVASIGTNYVKTSTSQVAEDLPPVLISAANVGVPYLRSYENQDSENDYNQEDHFSNPIVSKTFYTYSGPEEHDEKTAVHHITVGKPHQNYRVIYIKNPSSSASRALIKAHIAPTEEKTVVYVLSNNENQLNIESEVDEPAPTQPSKPEVVFIKYKNPEEIRHLQETVQNQYNALEGVNQVSDEGFAPVRSVIGALDDANGGAENSVVFGGGSTHKETIASGSSTGNGLVPGTFGAGGSVGVGGGSTYKQIVVSGNPSGNGFVPGILGAEGIQYYNNDVAPQFSATTQLKEVKSPVIKYY